MAEEQKIDDALRVAQALNLGDEEMELRFRQIVDNMGEAFLTKRKTRKSPLLITSKGLLRVQ